MFATFKLLPIHMGSSIGSLVRPYTSEQNGISERKHRHITETSLTLLA